MIIIKTQNRNIINIILSVAPSPNSLSITKESIKKIIMPPIAYAIPKLPYKKYPEIKKIIANI